MRLTVCLAALALCLPAVASNPGEPQDCSDWVISEPGFTCSHWAPHSQERVVQLTGDGVIDNQGNVWRTRRVRLGPCFASDVWRTEVVRSAGFADTVVAHVDDRCNLDGDDKIRQDSLAFDAANGTLLLTLASVCDTCSGDDYDALWTMALDGHATLFEVLQTYTPDPAEIGFRVPYMPEGMEDADWFDTYYGPLEKPLDLAQAQPLQCGYPATPPSTGDYLTVADTVPDPAPGEAVYYLTAATYQGETRVGRKADNAGRLSGREGSVLPDCIETATHSD